MFEQLRNGSAGQLRPGSQRAAFGCDSPDSPVGFIAVGVTEARLVMADDRIVPVADVQRAVRAKFYIDRTEISAGGADQWRRILKPKTCAVIHELDRPDRIIDISAGDQSALPVVGKMFRANNVPSTALASLAGRP